MERIQTGGDLYEAAQECLITFYMLRRELCGAAEDSSLNYYYICVRDVPHYIDVGVGPADSSLSV